MLLRRRVRRVGGRVPNELFHRPASCRHNRDRWAGRKDGWISKLMGMGKCAGRPPRSPPLPIRPARPLWPGRCRCRHGSMHPVVLGCPEPQLSGDAYFAGPIFQSLECVTRGAGEFMRRGGLVERGVGVPHGPASRRGGNAGEPFSSSSFPFPPTKRKWPSHGMPPLARPEPQRCLGYLNFPMMLTRVVVMRAQSGIVVLPQLPVPSGFSGSGMFSGRPRNIRSRRKKVLPSLPGCFLAPAACLQATETRQAHELGVVTPSGKYWWGVLILK